MTIVRATQKHVPIIAPLFDAYRVFYEQQSNIPAASDFLRSRLRDDESVIFLALQGDNPTGFTQLYTSFSSVSMAPILILNDLFVNLAYRKKGIGEALLERAKSYCKENNYKGLALETAIDNPAKTLYERLGWKKDVHCFHYFWTT